MVREILQLCLTSSQIASLFTLVSQNKDRLAIIQEVQIISFCLQDMGLIFFITYPELQVQSELESTNRTDLIFNISLITPIQRI